MTTTIADDVIMAGVKADAIYVGRVIRNITAPNAAPFAGILPFCLVPYLSLFVYESRAKLIANDPAMQTALSQDADAICARSRHSLKLFEDTQRGIEGQLDYFRDEILVAHSERFLNNTWFPPARVLETDLGIYSYAGRPIATTHAATFHMGIEPRALLEADAPYIQGLFAQYGSYFGKLGARLDAGADTFVVHLDSAQLDAKNDKRASKYYGRVFNGPTTPAINGLLVGFQAMMNFADSIISVGANIHDLEYTVFKIRYLTVYEVLMSLQLLRNDPAYPMSSASMDSIRTIVDTPEAQLITTRPTKAFRNTLMHYNLNHHVDLSRVDLGQPLFGLVPVYFPTHDLHTFSELVDRCIRETAAGLNTWAA